MDYGQRHRSNDNFQEWPDVLGVFRVIGRLRPQDKLSVWGKLEACGNLITKLDSRLSDGVPINKRNRLERRKKETDGLGIKDQSTSTLFVVVGQVNIQGVRFRSVGDVLLLVEG